MIWPLLSDLLHDAARILWAALAALALPALLFAALALLVKRRRALPDALRAAGETRLNLSIHLLDALLIAPPLALLLAFMQRGFDAYGLRVIPPDAWAALPFAVVALAAVVAGDFIGYWRHRLEHTRLLWPSHAVHHSDTEMTWLALARFHPVSRLATLFVDNAFLFALGLPAEALVVNNLVRHYWGHFIHADLPWTFGPLGPIIVSPAMHRWHHALDRRAHDTNFATILAVWDRLFGTWRVPGPCPGPLGVRADMGSGLAGQMLYPFRPATYRWRAPPPFPGEGDHAEHGGGGNHARQL
jgi:sterol desaturase/sphingolipid hydroxylase (fatty acid hydroxylase superfamily)